VKTAPGTRPTPAGWGWIATVLLVLVTPPAMARDLALVIGNAAYQVVPPLNGPREDAADMAKALEALGFRATVVTDASLDRLRSAVQRFQRSLASGDRAVVYLSGHGLQVEGKNWFLAVDGQPTTIEDVPQAAIRIDDLVEALGERQRTTIILLDACSDPGLRSRSGREAGAGLGRLATTPPNTLVVYAAGYGQLAAGRLRRNSLFTEKLLEHIDQAATLDDIVTQTRAAVFEISQGAQLPVIALNSLLTPGISLRPLVGSGRPPPGAEAVAGGQEAEAGKPGALLRDCPFCPELVVVPAGSFAMGSSSGEARERPVHEVRIPEPFAIGRYEVTVHEWQACVAAGQCQPKAIAVATQGGEARQAIGNISFDDAQTFIDWLSRETKRRYRLPSEAEWEFAARAGTRTAYFWGDQPAPQRMSCADCASRSSVRVDALPANPWGLYGVHGNLWEWVRDCYTANYDQKPRDYCEAGVVRGGAFDRPARFATSSFRGRGLATDEPGAAFGFRIARSLAR
jgi:formylglycine-generating enzyme required for sulfatase activity